MDLGGEDPAEELGDGAEDAAGFDLGGEAPVELSGADEFSIPGMDLGGEDPAGDSFDAFDLGGDALDAVPASGKDAAGEPVDMDKFTLPGIDDVFSDSVLGAGGRARGDAVGAGSSAEEVEEIQLTEEDLDQFQKTLAGYPLNLRIACEELIAEQAVAPDLMSKLVKMLIRGAPAREAASLAGKILGRTISIPRGFEKSTGAALEAEQGSFAYIFVHNFLPVLRLFLMVAVVAASLFYLIFQFVYTPLRAEKIYKLGYERLFAGEYQRANDRFSEAFRIHRHKKWFYRYAEAFRDERQYLYAEEKYDELLRSYPRDKKGVLDYAAMETGYLRNYAKAENLLRRNLLDYAPNDKEGLLALGDNSLAWGEIDKSKYEEARFAYARLLSLYGSTDPVVERMLLYFIRTDNLKEVLPLQAHFENKRRKISVESLAELGGYLLDKRLEEVRGVPNEYVEQIQGIRDLLLRAVKADPSLPEPHYHLARYYHSLNNAYEERITLETAIQAFDRSREGSVRRISYRIDAQKRYADVLINNREFFPAEEQLVKGAGIYEDALSRRLLARSPEFGRLYAGLGDLEYFTKAGDMETALQYYRRSEQHGWAPPEMLYRMGSAHYQREEWRDALERFFTASAELPLNRRLLYALGNASYQRGDYFAAQGYYNRLLDILESERARLPLLLPNDQPEYVELAERLMIARNNMGAAYEALAEQTADTRYRSRALALYSESARAWDALTRNPQTMARSLPAPDTFGPGVNLPYLNSRYILYPQPGYEVQIFPRIDKDVLEPSIWENLAPQGGRLSQ
jgi:tetratricopeptide (TPR) repeat protein